MIPVTIRPYRNEDFPRIHLLEMEGGHESYRSAVFIRQMGVICGNTFLVATVDGEPAGYTIGALVQGAPREAWILRMGVRKDQRRNGIGSILLAGLLDLLRGMDVQSVRLTVSPENGPALALYRKCGFSQAGYHEAYFGDDEDRIMMVNEIG
ncbi:MAG TPA: GNAT family N-acetyltransferase [Methanoregula sp.]|nr:GNAT family N-acetyltransferase [Methanoregula sp.]